MLTTESRGQGHYSIGLLFFIIFLILLTSKAHAQQSETHIPGKILGRIIDSVSVQPIEYATISLVTQTDNKIVNGATTDSKGVFKITDVTDGIYKIVVYFIGYRIDTINSIVVSKSNPVISLDDISLVNNLTVLKEAVVTADKNIIENKIDKMVYHADKDITSQSGVAIDILKKIPQVSVDIDGNVELQGNTGIRFLINGKPSTVFGNNITDVLQAIPASQIQSVEVITSPGAKYDAEGTAGIINIILKKSTAEGFNGNVSLSAGTRLENGSVNLSAHHGHLNVNTFFSGNVQLSSGTLTHLNRTSPDAFSMLTSQLLQNGDSDFKRGGYQSGLGLDWDVSPHNNISGSIGFDFFGNRNEGIVNRQSILLNESGTTLTNLIDNINTANRFHWLSFDYDLNYKRTFNKEDQELDISFNSSNGNNSSYYDQTQTRVSTDSIIGSSYGDNPGIENETNIGIDYTHPLSDHVHFETGAKAVLNHIQSTSDVYLLNPDGNSYDFNSTLSSFLDYKSQVYAGYFSGTFHIMNDVDLNAGLRYEYTQIDATYSESGNVNIKPYSTYVPSMTISRSLQRNQVLKLSYSHRIERPEYRDLNPFINASDPKNITTGNTNLRPEIGDKIELGYSRNYDNGISFYSSLFYRGNHDDIQSFTQYYPSYAIGDSTYYNVAISTRENIGREDNIGLSLFVSVPATSKFNLRTNISCFQRYIDNGDLPGENVHGFNYRANLNMAYDVTDLMSVEFFGNFNSPRVNAQGKMPSYTSYSFAFRQQLFHKNGSIAITATNPFDKYIVQRTELTGVNFTSNTTRQLPYRAFGINFTYKFGKIEFKDEKQMDDMNPSDSSSAN